MTDVGLAARAHALEFAAYVQSHQAALFVGAGLSRSAGMPDWKELLSEQAHLIGLDIDRVSDYPALAQYIVNADAGNKSLLENHIHLKLLAPPSLQAVHRELARLPIDTIWTTNYDGVLELAYQAKLPGVKVGDRSLLAGLPPSGVTIYKMHGTIVPQPIDLVITQDDYEYYSLRYPLMCRQLVADFTSKSFLFLGFSFTDPNVRFILGQVRALLANSTRSHYFVYRVSTDHHLQREHDLWLQDLRRHGIKGIPVRDYAEVPSLLESIRREALARSVLISGSYDAFDLESVCQALGREIARRGLILLSGEGRNVATFISEGAFNYLIDSGKKYSDQIQLFRVPRFARRHMNERYRKYYRLRMIERARVAVVIAGAGGTLEEVDLCVSNNVPVLPLAWTGGTAAATWQRLSTGGLPRCSLTDADLELLREGPPVEPDQYAANVFDLVERVLAST